jgi:hypothetical protein
MYNEVTPFLDLNFISKSRLEINLGGFLIVSKYFLEISSALTRRSMGNGKVFAS